MAPTYLFDSYSPELHAKLADMLAGLDDDELLALVPDPKRKSPEAKALLLAELRKRVSPNQLPDESQRINGNTR